MCLTFSMELPQVSHMVPSGDVLQMSDPTNPWWTLLNQFTTTYQNPLTLLNLYWYTLNTESNTTSIAKKLSPPYMTWFRPIHWRRVWNVIESCKSPVWVPDLLIFKVSETPNHSTQQFIRLETIVRQQI